MRWLVLGALGAALVVARPAEAARLRLIEEQLAAPAPDVVVDPGTVPMPVGNRIGAIILSYLAGVNIDAGIEMVPLFGLLLASIGTRDPFGAPIGVQIGITGGLIFLQSLAGTAAIWGITRAFGGHPSFRTMWAFSAGIRVLISAFSIGVGNGNGGWILGTFAVAPAAGVLTEIIAAQFDEEPAAPAPPSEDQTRPEAPASTPAAMAPPRMPLIPLVAMSF